MALLFYLFALLGIGAGVGWFWVAKGANHELEALLLFLIGTVFLCSAVLLNALLD